MKNTIINRGVIKKVAAALEEINQDVIYVGGAVVSLYVNDPAADDVRPTKDLDISLSVATSYELETIREKLITKGFFQSSEDDVICRFRYEDVLIDVMNTSDILWAPANPWFKPGFVQRESRTIESQQIFILPFSYFLASKLSAYQNRGKNDPIMSKDFEDIGYLLDNVMDFEVQLESAPKDVKGFLKVELKDILTNKAKQEAIEGNLFYEFKDQRFIRMMEKLEQFCNN